MSEQQKSILRPKQILKEKDTQGIAFAFIQGKEPCSNFVESN